MYVITHSLVVIISAVDVVLPYHGDAGHSGAVRFSGEAGHSGEVQLSSVLEHGWTLEHRCKFQVVEED